MKTAIAEKAEVKNIRIVVSVDDDADTSFVGEYCEDFEGGVIVRQYGEYYEKLTEEERDNIRKSGREYSCFRPEAGGEKVGTEDYYKYGMQDYKRMEGLNNGDWCFIGITAECDVFIGDAVQTFHSGGLGGIESDSGEHIEEEKKNQLEDLRNQLEAFGIEVPEFILDDVKVIER